MVRKKKIAKKILIVDDDPSILDALSSILADEGFTVTTISKGKETYHAVASFKPDLILLDVLMSGNDGRHICKKLKEEEATKHIPVIMISAHPSAATSIMVCGAQDFLAKPFNSEELMTAISGQLK